MQQSPFYSKISTPAMVPCIQSVTHGHTKHIASVAGNEQHSDKAAAARAG